MRLWCLCILLMCFWCISVLIEDSKRVKYVLAENSTEGNHFQLGCFSLKRLDWANETVLKLEELPSKINNYIDRLERSSIFYRSELFEEIILKPIKLREYFVFKDSFCVVIRNITALTATVRLFTTYYRFNRDTYDHSKACSRGFSIREAEHQLIVLDRRQLQKKCRKHYSKAKCLNECIKRKQRLAKYLYSANESGLVLLDYDEESKSVKANERECIKQCKSDGCKLVYYIPRREDGAATVFEVRPILSTFEFCIQLLGLIGFFANLSLSKLLFKLVEFSVLKEPKLSNHRPLLELAVPSVCLLLCLALYVRMVLDHVHRTFQPLSKEITMNSFKIEQMDLIICIPANNILENDYHKMSTIKSYLKGLNSFSELEKGTDAGWNQLENIWISYQNRWTNINWTVKANETLFMHWYKLLHRCFRVEIDYPPAEAKYRELLSITKLVVKLKNPLSRIYLLPRGQSFSKSSLFHMGRFGFGKCVIERTKLSDKCVDYRQKNGSEKKEVKGGEGRGDESESCDSRASCISLCINREFMNNFQSVSLLSPVIDKTQFTAEEWNRSHPANRNITLYSMVEEKCREKYWNKDCTEILQE